MSKTMVDAIYSCVAAYRDHFIHIACNTANCASTMHVIKDIINLISICGCGLVILNFTCDMSSGLYYTIPCKLSQRDMYKCGEFWKDNRKVGYICVSHVTY